VAFGPGACGHLLPGALRELPGQGVGAELAGLGGGLVVAGDCEHVAGPAGFQQDIPETEHDFSVNYIVTSDEVIPCTHRRRPRGIV
jgi:hypothetical protein